MRRATRNVAIAPKRSTETLSTSDQYTEAEAPQDDGDGSALDPDGTMTRSHEDTREADSSQEQQPNCKRLKLFLRAPEQRQEVNLRQGSRSPKEMQTAEGINVLMDSVAKQNATDGSNQSALLMSRRFKCPWHEGCSESYDRPSQLEVHYREHTDERPLTCQYGSCSKTFQNHSTLKVHLRVHTDEYPYTCSYGPCSREFKWKSSLDSHRCRHNKCPHACDHESCTKAFERTTHTADHRLGRIRKAMLTVPLPNFDTANIYPMHNKAPLKVDWPTNSYIEPMAHVYSAAWDNDKIVKFMCSQMDLWKTTVDMIKHRYGGPSFVFRSAVNEYTGDIVGWVCYGDIDIVQDQNTDSVAYMDWTTAAFQISLIPSSPHWWVKDPEKQHPSPDKIPPESKRDPRYLLASRIQARSMEGQERTTPNGRFVINALVTHPLCRRQGVASRLLAEVAKIADGHGRPMWVQVPEGALGEQVIFNRAGFINAGEYSIDLGSFAAGSDSGSKEKMGTYKWNYLVRWPQPLPFR